MIRFKIKEIDFRRGVIGCSQKCPVARGFKRFLREKNISMDISTLEIDYYQINVDNRDGDSFHLHYTNVDKVSQFIEDFDDRLKPRSAHKPFWVQCSGASVRKIEGRNVLVD